MKKKAKTGKVKHRAKKLSARKDFDQPVKKVAPAQRDLLDVHLTVKEPEKLVRNSRMSVVYVKPHFDRNKKGSRYVAFEVSQQLTREHDGLLPKPVADAYSDIAKKNRKRVDLINLKAQLAKFFLTHDDREPALTLMGARVSHVSLQVIEEKGTGKANKVIRLSYRLRVPLSRDVAHFAEWNFGDRYWLYMEESQGHLLEEEEEDLEEEPQEDVEQEPEEEAAATPPPAEEDPAPPF